MKKNKSQKVLQWKTKDIVLNVVTYAINTLIIAGLFVGSVYLESRSGTFDYFSNPNNFLHFFILLVLLVGLMASYFFFEDRDFLNHRNIFDYLPRKRKLYKHLRASAGLTCGANLVFER